MQRLDEKGYRAIYLLVLVFVLLAAGMITAGILSYQKFEDRHRAEVEQQLSVIADLKVGQLAQWRKERTGDAAVLYGNKIFSSLVRRYFNHPDDREAQRQLWTWLSKIQLGYSYERLLLIDDRDNLRMSVPDTKEPVAPGILRRAAIVMDSEQVDFRDFHRDELDQRIYLTITVPILHEEPGRQPLGALVLRIDPETDLYPFIRYWPTPGKTAETLLVRREGNEVVLLNDLRFQEKTALNLRFPLENRDSPKVRAMLDGEGIVEGKDHRGIPVIAAARTIPDSPWSLSVRMDFSEVHGPLAQRRYLTIISIVLLLGSIGMVIVLLRRQQHTRFYRERFEMAEALRESEERFRQVVDNMNEVFWLRSADNRDMLYISPAYESIWGRTRQSLYENPDTFLDSVADEDKPLVLERVKAYLQGKPYDLEYRIVRPDGDIRWIWAKSFPVKDERGNTVRHTGMAVDITDRKQAEAKIQQLAYHDRLTGLPNRELFSDRLGIALAQARRNQRGVAVTMLDLDHFKDVNDTLGHDTGDLLLKAAAERLNAVLRKGDTVARFGGDEFVLILPGLKGLKDVVRVAQKIVESFRKPFLIDTHQLTLTTSIGIAVYPRDGTDETTLLKKADIAMYQVKQTGRNRYQIFKED